MGGCSRIPDPAVSVGTWQILFTEFSCRTKMKVLGLESRVLNVLPLDSRRGTMMEVKTGDFGGSSL